MQLIVDATATIDIVNMSTINEESLNEKFSTKIIEDFSNNIFNNVEEVKDRVSGFVEIKKEALENEEIHEKQQVKKFSTITTEGEKQKCDGVKDEDICLSNSQLDIKKEPNDVIDENEEIELVPTHNTQDIEMLPNMDSDHTTLGIADIKISSSYAEKLEFVEDKVNMKNVNTIDLDDKTNDSYNESQLENEVSINSVKTIKEELNNPNDDNIIIVDSQIQNESRLISNDIKNVARHTAEELLNNIPKKDDGANSDSNAISSLQINASQNDVEFNNIEECDKDSVIEIDQMDDANSELKLVNIENNAEKLESEVKTGDSKKETTEEFEGKKIKKLEEKLGNKNYEEKKKLSLISKLSNTLDILSDDEDEKHEQVLNIEKPTDISDEKQCINLVDDDDIMLVDEETSTKTNITSNDIQGDQKPLDLYDLNEVNKCSANDQNMDTNDGAGIETCTGTIEKTNTEKCDTIENVNIKPLLPSNFLKTCKKNLAEMSREDLEEFCILKIVESVVDRSSLGDIRTQLKNMALTVEEYKKKALMLTKQNRDLQVVLKSVQEEQKKGSEYPISPLKITRSVGMQVFMTDKPNAKKKSLLSNVLTATQTLPLDKPNRNTSNQKSQKISPQQIPVPRLVPAANTSNNKSCTSQCSTAATANTGKSSTNNQTLTNGVKSSPHLQKPEKRSRVQSVTVDLTDDEPPSKISTRSSPVPPVRLVPAKNLMATQRPQFPNNINSPRKVYIPISGPQAQNIRPGQTIMLKSVPPNTGPKPRGTNNITKVQSGRTNRIQYNRHPAPLPDVITQYQPPNWKALPPAPDLKLSKVDNGIVISWKIEGYQEDSYEEITSYQLYAYQETQCPPNTTLWKKIGDVKALPLPMACTLTQFMTGHKYYFAVRAVDIKSRFGPFSIPGSIILLNKI